MLDHEPDATNQPTTSTPDPADAPPPIRRRRAAVRAAGPPGGTEGAPVIESVSSDAEPSTEEASAPASAGGDGASGQLPDPTANQSPVPQTAAKRARTTSSAKKAPARKISKQAVPPADQDAAPTTRAPRKRSAKKAAAALDASSPASALAEMPHLDGPADLPPESMVTKADSQEPVAVQASAAAEHASAEQELVDVQASAAEQASAEQELVDVQASGASEQASAEQELVDVQASAAAEQPSGEQAPVEVQASPAAEQPSGDSTDGRDGEKEQITYGQEDADVGDQPDALDDSVGGIEQGTDEASDDEAGASGDEPTRRRRRRRGGRRRRRSGDESDTEEPHGPDNLELPSGEEKQLTDGLAEPPAAPSADEPDAGEESSERDGQRRRRRRRRRRGEDAVASPDDPSDVVVRVRESRRERPSREVTGIEGSTRMEAKRQRRREGREAGRRRPAILSEAEFLARRESVVRRMIIRQRDDLAQIAVLEDDILVEHYVDRDSATSSIGNVYLGRVQNVLPSMEAAFIDIGRGRNAVLYAGEVDWDAFGAEGQGRKVEKVLKSGQ